MPVTFSGFNSGIDTDDVIQKLVDVERRPIIRMQNEKKDLQFQKEVWKDFNKELAKLNAIVKSLYGYDRVFKNRKILSRSDEYFTATAMDNAPKGEHSIEVMGLATAHKVLSDEQPEEKEWPGAVLTVTVGPEKAEVKGFESGGKLEKLVEALNDEAGKIIRASLMKTDEGRVILSVQALKTGSKNLLEISGGDRLLEALGISGTDSPGRLEHTFNGKTPPELPYSPEGWSNTSCLFLEKKRNTAFPLKESVSTRDGMIEFVSRSAREEEKASGRLIQKNIGSVSIRELVISGANFIINKLSGLVAKEEGEAFIRLVSEKEGEMTVPLRPSSSWTNNAVKIEKLDRVTSIEFVNLSGENFYLDNLRIYSKAESRKIFRNVAEKPGDARLKVDNIEIKRDRNDNLNDIINGVNLTLLKKSGEPVRMEVRTDIEGIEKKLGEFIAQYNAIISYIAEAGKTSKAKKPGEAAAKEKGALSNDMSLMNLNSKLRSTIVNSYITSLGDKLALLSQMGISTGRWGSNWDDIKKGLLELNKEKFIDAMGRFDEKTGEIFGYDSDRDKIIDTGVAYELEKTIKGFIQNKGVIDGKVALIDAMIKDKDRNITRKEDQVEKYRDQLKTKFSKMNRGLQGLKGQQDALQNQIKNLPQPDTSKKDKEE